jgi:hypothetical protein
MTLAVVDVIVTYLYPILGLGNGGALGNRQAHLISFNRTESQGVYHVHIPIDIRKILRSY